MSPDYRAKLKALQVAATQAAVLGIKDDYIKFKDDNRPSFINQKDNYVKGVVNTHQIVETTLKGKTNASLNDVLEALIEDDSSLLDGFESIVYAFKEKEPLPTNEWFRTSNSLDTNTIEMKDEYLLSKVTLANSIPALNEIQQRNDQLFNQITDIFKQDILEITAILSELSYSEVEAIAIQEGLAPIDNISLSAVDNTNTYINNKINLIDKTINDIQASYTNLHDVDKWLTLLSKEVKDGKKEKNQWLENMKDRKDDEVVAYYRDFYGLTQEEAELWLEYDKAFIEYCERNNLTAERASYEYSRNIGSFVYGGDFQFDSMAGTMKYKDLKKKFEEDFNMDGEKFDKLRRGLLRSHDPYDDRAYDNKTSKKIVNEDGNTMITLNADSPNPTYESAGNYESRALDIAHTHVAVAMEVGEDLYGPGGYNRDGESFATFHGDIASGQYDIRDVRADAEAQNIIHRYQDSDYKKGPLTVIDEYNQEIAIAQSPNQRRMGILSEHYGSDQALFEHIHTQINDPRDILLKKIYKNDETFDNASEIQGLIQGDLSGENG